MTNAAMTNERILAVCRSNWEYRGIDEASVREMMDELSAHLEDAAAAGRTPQDVVGNDVKAFAASWARARASFPRRALRTLSLACCMIGCVLLISCLVHWTAHLPVTADRLVFYAVLTAVTVTWEIRRGTLGLAGSWGIALVAGLPAVLLTNWLAGDEALFTLPLWFLPVLLLPGIPYLIADERAKKATEPATD
ncbi:hypothetical protein [Streptomyces sp. NPDC053048]|uniref:hypothetical protein n=1 Tax=Streptomyces sp. NPDC053048 TaxID=3365694 RepID=UPI0037D08B31